jgi:hypothetical protein
VVSKVAHGTERVNKIKSTWSPKGYASNDFEIILILIVFLVTNVCILAAIIGKLY